LKAGDAHVSVPLARQGQAPAGAVGRPLQHLQVAVGVAEGGDGAPES
jgi:hypothetical protein